MRKIRVGKQLVAALVLALLVTSGALTAYALDNLILTQERPYVCLYLLTPIAIVIAGGLIAAAILYASDGKGRDGNEE